MTGEQANTAKVIIFGMTCLAMLGIYGVACWLGNRATSRAQERLLMRVVPPPAEEAAMPVELDDEHDLR